MTDANRTADSIDPPLNESALPYSKEAFGFGALVVVEMLLFSALLGGYFLLRFQTGSDSWPTPQEIGIPAWMPLAGGLALLCSIGSCHLAATACSAQQTRKAIGWSVLTVLLGLGFASFKTLEFQACGRNGLSPLKSRNLIRDRADLAYLSAVKTCLRSSLDDQAIIAMDRELPDGFSDLDLIYTLQSGLVGWTEKVVGRTDDPTVTTLALSSVGYQIDPRGFPDNRIREIAGYLESERDRIGEELVAKSRSMNRQTARLKDAQAEIQRLRSLGPDQETSLNAQLELASELTSLVTGLQTQITAMESRIRYLKLSGSFQTESFQTDSAESVSRSIEGQLTLGLNQRYSFRLPRVIPNGNAWMDTYFLLNGVHLLHVVLGILALLWMILTTGRKSGSLTSSSPTPIRLASQYWQFLSLIGLTILLLIYVF